MYRVLSYLAHEHDLRLVALSALICILKCITTTTCMARAGDGDNGRHRR